MGPYRLVKSILQNSRGVAKQDGASSGMESRGQEKPPCPWERGLSWNYRITKAVEARTQKATDTVLTLVLVDLGSRDKLCPTCL